MMNGAYLQKSISGKKHQNSMQEVPKDFFLYFYKSEWESCVKNLASVKSNRSNVLSSLENLRRGPVKRTEGAYQDLCFDPDTEQIGFCDMSY
ncbi:hypothetical protein SNEBB_008887 [Seison nebaliae]|nr:hypothetical protein SNEBB_008887 [Seison nebaliae]